MSNEALNAYKQNTILTATPEELTLMLYEGAIKFMKMAKYCIENKDLAKAHSSLIRAQDIIMELNTTLNMDYEISHDLRRLYNFTYERLIDANIKKDVKPIDDALEIITEMRDTWKEVIQQVRKKVYQNK